MMRYVCAIIMMFTFIFGEGKTLSKKGVRPEWATKGEQVLNDKRSNDTYYFKAITIAGPNISDLVKDRVNQLSNYIGQSNNISGNAERDISQINTEDNLKSSDSFTITYHNEIGVSTFYARFVDDYWEYISYPDGSKGYEYYALFAVSQNGQNTFCDIIDFTTSYGAKPIAMSIIPGMGQWYKGSKAKGVCMFAAEAVAVAGIIVCENQRSAYIKKSVEHPKFVREYSDKAKSWKTGRNICIGAAAGVWMYNLIDAAVAKGARRVVVRRADGRGLSMMPFGTPETAGISFAYNF